MSEIPGRFKTAVREQQIEFVCRTITAQLIANYTVGAAVVWLLKDIYPLSALLTWYACMIAAYALRHVMLKFFWQARRQSKILGVDWNVWFTLSNFLGGLAWGYAFYGFYSPTHLAESMIIVALTVGFVAGSLGSHLAYLPAFAVYSTTALGMMVLRLFLEGGHIEVIIGFLGIFYYFVMIVSARESQNLVKQAIVARLQVEELNQELVDQHQELITAKEAAEKANIAKSKFLATASHDLRQPLHALRLFVDILDERVTEPSLKNVAQKITTTTDALEGLFSNLLELAKAEARVIEPHYKAIRLSEFLQNIYMESEPLAERKGLFLRVHCRDVLIHTDPTVLTRIVRNFVINAIRYTNEGGILIGCRKRGTSIRIEIHDTGVGIPAAHLPKVFDEFHQVSNPERDRSKGLGLGLAIADRLAGILNAPLGVWSEEGHGSCFSVTVPIASGKPTVTAQPAQANLPAPTIAGLRIVFIDDEQEIRDAMKELFESWECEYLLAEDLTDALEQISEWDFPPNIIVTDYRLRDGLLGTQVITELRDRFQHQIPAIIVTGDTSPERLKDAMSSGATVLHKPIKAIKLRMLIEQLVATPRLS